MTTTTKGLNGGKMPTLTTGQYLDAVFSGVYDENKIKEIKKWQKQINSTTNKGKGE